MSLVFHKFDRDYEAKMQIMTNAKTNQKYSAMNEKEQILRAKISDDLMKQFPDLKPKIAEITDNTFTYELEKHSNFTYYIVRYDLSAAGELTVDWDNAELTVI
jgi:hypothetical protein